MSLANTAARGARITLVAQWSKFVIQLLSTVILARILAPAEFGSFAMIVAVTGFAALLGDFGLSTAVIQARDISPAQQSNLFWINSVIGLSAAALIFALAKPIAGFYGRPELTALTRALAATFVLQSMSTQFNANIARTMRFTALAVSDICAQLLAASVAISLALLGFGVWALVAQQLTAAFGSLLILSLAARWLPGLPSRAPMRPLLRFGVHAFGVQALNYLSTNIDSVLLGRYLGAIPLGFYDRAYQLFRQPVQQIGAPMTRVALPVLSRHQDDPATMSRYLAAGQTLITYVLGAAFCSAAALAEPLIVTVLGPQWRPSAPLFAILAIGGLFQSMGYVYYWSFLARGLAGLQLRYSMILRALMSGLIVAGVTLGTAGVASAVTLGLFCNWLILTLYPMRRTGLDVAALVRAAARPALIHVLVGGAVLCVDRLLLAPQPPVLRLLLGGATAVAGYTLCWLLSPAIRRDVAVILDMVRRSR